MKATEKQLNLIRWMEDFLGYKFDYKNGTKKEASEYISKHIDEYGRYVKRHSYELCFNWDNECSNG